jgi:tetratricopeptide (TPR) repeat protein
VPVKSENKNWLEYGRIDTDILYNNLMNNFVWRGASDPGVNIDYYHRRTLTVVRARLLYARLAHDLAAEGKKDKAKEVLQRCMETFPVSKIGYDIYFVNLISAWFDAGDNGKAIEISREVADYYLERSRYFLDQRPGVALYAEQDISQSIQIVSEVISNCYDHGELTIAEELNGRLNEVYAKYMALKK